MIRNIEALTRHGVADLRAMVLSLANDGLKAARPDHATAQTVRLEGDYLIADGVAHVLHHESRVVVVGAGKASLRIAATLERILGDRISGGAVAVPEGTMSRLRRVELLQASHPVPSVKSVAAAMRISDYARELTATDLVITCFTGGSSALVAWPPVDVTLDDKRALSRILLASGLPITAVNTVRKHVSAIKGGRLARTIAPARVLNLTISDVPGDELDAICDPTVVDTTTAADAVAVLEDNGLWESVPARIKNHLATASAESPKLTDVSIHSVVMATGQAACDAMVASAMDLGLEPLVLSYALEGESREVGRFLGHLTRESCRRGAPFRPPCVLLGCGGETTVTGPVEAFGEGGPNQEAAIAAGLALDGGEHVAGVFLDTDGSDGGSLFAGGVFDGSTRARARALGSDLERAVRTHRASSALAPLGDVVMTGPTHTNVNDLFAVAIGSVLTSPQNAMKTGLALVDSQRSTSRLGRN